jgi:hypothetical protein
MELSSARLTPVRSTSKHERRILLAGVTLFILGAALSFLEISNPELPRFAFGAAGVALVYFAQSEAVVWRRPLTLGHQLSMWWFWAFAVPVFFAATRHRRRMVLTLAVIIPFAGFLLILVALFVRDITRIL